MDYDAMEQYWIWLASIPELTGRRFYGLIEAFGDARAVWDNPEEACAHLTDYMASAFRRQRTERAFYRLFDRLDRLAIRVVTRLSDDYPGALSTIHDPPPALFVQGDAARLRDPHRFAIVGARSATHDGLRAAHEFSEGLGRADVTVVSGLARGIDSAAHQGIVDVGGHTVAVLGCGVEIVYPPENAHLKRRILELGGAVVSEHPPGVQPKAANFPARNRIISGISEGVLLVEGRRPSGAMITVDHALAQARDVFAIPGSIYSPLSEAPNQLIFDGAYPARSHWDILEHFRWGARPAVQKARSAPEAPLSDEEKALVEPLRLQKLSFDELSALTGFNSGKLNSLLTILELRGIIKQLPGRCYRA